MTRTARRLAELDQICAERSLTDDEQREVMLLANRERQYARVAHLYRTDLAYRERRLNEVRRHRRLPEGPARTKADAARARHRDLNGRFA